MTGYLTQKRTWFAALVLLALVAGGCGINPATGERRLSLISRDQEIAMGEEAAPQFEKEFDGKVPDEQLQQYVQMVGQKVAAVSDREMPYEYTLVASKVPNAFALPGGKIFITAGLMSRMTNEQQLAAVLGHETAHVAAMHNVDQMQNQMGMSILLEIAATVIGGDKGEAAKAGGQIVAGMVSLKYSRGDEYEADEYGLKYMTSAGYNPWGMVELLDILYSLSESEPGSLTEMFQTHPLTSKRIEAVKEMIESKDDYKRFSSKARDPHTNRFVRMHKRLLSATAEGQ